MKNYVKHSLQLVCKFCGKIIEADFNGEITFNDSDIVLVRGINVEGIHRKCYLNALENAKKHAEALNKDLSPPKTLFS